MTFTAGDLVYSEDGHEHEYAGAFQGMHVVRPLIAHGDETTTSGEVLLVEKVYGVPPTERLHEKVEQLNAEIIAANEKLLEIRNARRDEDRDIKERQARLKRHSQLEYLDDFIAGKITHFVLSGYEQVEVKEFLQIRKYGKCGFPLLTLFGDSRGDLNWRVNEYRDGSGRDMDVIPCLSVEHASEVARQETSKLLNQWLSDPSGMNPDTLLNSCNLHGVTVPSQLTDFIFARRLEMVNTKRKVALATLDAINREMADLSKATSE